MKRTQNYTECCVFFLWYGRHPQFSGASGTAYATHNQCLCLAVVATDQEGFTSPLQLRFLWQAQLQPRSGERSIISRSSVINVTSTVDAFLHSSPTLLSMNFLYAYTWLFSQA